jgi:hypothetical protein
MKFICLYCKREIPLNYQRLQRARAGNPPQYHKDCWVEAAKIRGRSF